MSFDNNKNLTCSKKITLVELNIDLVVKYWANLTPFTWYYDFTLDFPDVDSELKEDFPEYNINFANGVRSDNVVFTSKTSIAEVEAEAETFYWDDGNQILYIHCQNNDEPFLFDVIVSDVYGYSNFEGNYGDIFYEGRLSRVSNFSKKKDALNFGRIQYAGATFELNNSDGKFDTLFLDNNAYGQKIKVLYGFNDDDYSEFKQVYEGVVNKLAVDTQKVSVGAVDGRIKFDVPLNQNYFSKSQYPEIADTDENKPIPWIFGIVKRCPGYNTRGATTSLTEYTFKLADTDISTRFLISIDDVYVNGVSIDSAYYVTDRVDGSVTVTVTPDIFAHGDDVSADVIGFTSSTGDVKTGALPWIGRILDDRLGIPETTGYYSTEWFDSDGDNPYGAYWIGNGETVLAAIEKISEIEYGNFIIQDDGLYNFIPTTTDSTASLTIVKEEILDSPKYTLDSKEITSRLIINYNEKIEDNIFNTIIYSSNETFTVNSYGILKERSYDLNVRSTDGTDVFANKLFYETGDLSNKASVLVPPKYIDLEIGDTIAVELDRPVNTFLGEKTCQVTGITKNLLRNNVKLDLRILD